MRIWEAWEKMDQKESDIVDIVDILRFWETANGIPDELGNYLAMAADEIAGLREENKYLTKIIDEASPRF